MWQQSSVLSCAVSLDQLTLEERVARCNALETLLKGCSDKFDVSMHPRESVVFASLNGKRVKIDRVPFPGVGPYVCIETHERIDTALKHCASTPESDAHHTTVKLLDMFKSIYCKFVQHVRDIKQPVPPSRRNFRIAQLVKYVDYIMRACERCLLQQRCAGMLYSFGILVAILHHFSSVVVTRRERWLPGCYLVFFEACMQHVRDLASEAMTLKSSTRDAIAKARTRITETLTECTDAERERRAEFTASFRRCQTRAIREIRDLISTFGSIDQGQWTDEETGRFDACMESQRSSIQGQLSIEADARKRFETARSTITNADVDVGQLAKYGQNAVEDETRMRLVTIKAHALLQLKDQKQRMDSDAYRERLKRRAQEKQSVESAKRLIAMHDAAKKEKRIDLEKGRKRNHSNTGVAEPQALCLDTVDLTRPLDVGEIRIRPLATNEPRPITPSSKVIEFGSWWAGTCLGFVETAGSRAASKRAIKPCTHYPARAPKRARIERVESISPVGLSSPPDSGLSRSASSCDESPAPADANEEYYLPLIGESQTLPDIDHSWFSELCADTLPELALDTSNFDEGFDASNPFYLLTE